MIEGKNKMNWLKIKADYLGEQLVKDLVEALIGFHKRNWGKDEPFQEEDIDKFIAGYLADIKPKVIKELDKAGIKIKADSHKWVVLPSGTRVNFTKPLDNEFIKDWEEYEANNMSYEIMQKSDTGRYICIAGSNTNPYGNVGAYYVLMHDQTGKYLGDAIYVAHITASNFKDAEKYGSMPLYVFK